MLNELDRRLLDQVVFGVGGHRGEYLSINARRRLCGRIPQSQG
jgi:hypothetical protein